MLKIEKFETYNFEGSIRGMRNPLNSWGKSDTVMSLELRRGTKHAQVYANIGSNDLDLMKRLYKAGSEHAKFMRQIMCSFDMTTNHVVWAEFDTYKVGVTRNSCSKMHKIHVHPIDESLFSCEGVLALGGGTLDIYRSYLNEIERLRQLYNETHDKMYWRAIIEMLPMGFNLKATITCNYATLANMINQRSGHKMFEWGEFCEYMLKNAPYLAEIMGNPKHS